MNDTMRNESGELGDLIGGLDLEGLEIIAVKDASALPETGASSGSSSSSSCSCCGSSSCCDSCSGS